MKAICIRVAFAFSLISPFAAAQEKPEPPSSNEQSDSIVIQFKIFDANNPRAELRPDLTRKPIILLRNLYTQTEELFLGDRNSDAAIRPSTDRQGFYEITLPKGRLINQMFIDVEQTNTNPAALIKMVTANNIVVYPGASNSLENFPFSAFLAQLNQYSSLMSQINSERPGQTTQIRELLQKRYGTLLLNMKQVLVSGKVTMTPIQKDEQTKIARNALNSVLRSYGLQPVDDAQQSPLVEPICRPCPCFTNRCHRRGCW